MATLPLPTLAAQISANGISAPAFENVLNSEIATYQSIYGSDSVLTPDTQDGQLLSIRATAPPSVSRQTSWRVPYSSSTLSQGAGCRVAPASSRSTTPSGSL